MDNNGSGGAKPTAEKLAFNAKELCSACGFSRITLWRLMRRGLIRPLKCSRTLLFPRAEVERFLRENLQETEARNV